MKLFACQNCGQLLYFQNTQCERCGCKLGFDPRRTLLMALHPANDSEWVMVGEPAKPMRFCANAEYDACNWLLPAEDKGSFCYACRLNRTIPDLSSTENLLLWRMLEIAKHRLVYGLIRFGLPVTSKMDDAELGLAFDFLTGSEHAAVTTGHHQGTITLDAAEADDASREFRRANMAEPYRTLLGHFRHEAGHYYWMRLVERGSWLPQFRETFGDERQDYQRALAAHYADGPPQDWREHFISRYAASHPWEDFAESWAHYLHIVDTLETAWAFGLRSEPDVTDDPRLMMQIPLDPYLQDDFDALFQAWTPLTSAVNSLNESMGQPPLYPFVLAPDVMAKLRFTHMLMRSAGNGTWQTL
jgi:hypothetical protein